MNTDEATLGNQEILLLLLLLKSIFLKGPFQCKEKNYSYLFIAE